MQLNFICKMFRKFTGFSGLPAPTVCFCTLHGLRILFDDSTLRLNTWGPWTGEDTVPRVQENTVKISLIDTIAIPELMRHMNSL